MKNIPTFLKKVFVLAGVLILPLFSFSSQPAFAQQCLTSGLCLGTMPTPFPTTCQGNGLVCPNRSVTQCTVACSGGNLFHCNGTTITKDNSSTTNNLLAIASCSSSVSQLVVGQNGTCLGSPDGLTFNSINFPFDAPPVNSSTPYNDDYHFAIYNNG